MAAAELVPTGGCSRLRLTPGLSPSEAGTGGGGTGGSEVPAKLERPKGLQSHEHPRISLTRAPG